LRAVIATFAITSLRIQRAAHAAATAVQHVGSARRISASNRRIHADQVCFDVLGVRLGGTRADLHLLQRVLDRGVVEPGATYTLQALGLAFGKVFVAENRGYDWWMVEDEYGRDPAIRYERSSLLAYLRTMISKRIEDGEVVDVVDLYDGLVVRLEQLVDEGWGQPSEE
jgi:hypothetical protein